MSQVLSGFHFKLYVTAKERPALVQLIESNGGVVTPLSLLAFNHHQETKSTIGFDTWYAVATELYLRSSLPPPLDLYEEVLHVNVASAHPKGRLISPAELTAFISARTHWTAWLSRSAQPTILPSAALHSAIQKLAAEFYGCERFQEWENRQRTRCLLTDQQCSALSGASAPSSDSKCESVNAPSLARQTSTSKVQQKAANLCLLFRYLSHSLVLCSIVCAQLQTAHIFPQLSFDLCEVVLCFLPPKEVGRCARLNRAARKQCCKSSLWHAICSACIVQHKWLPQVLIDGPAFLDSPF
jgi:hypothetical protein